jgi:hypothetical protein
MKHLFSLFAGSILFVSTHTYAQTVPLNKHTLEPVNVQLSIEKSGVKAIKDSSIIEVDEPTFVKVKNSDFRNGTIEVKVLSKLLKNAPPLSRGFIGVAFRINKENTQFENIYIRPTNGRAEDQLRRNHSTQYFSYPDYKFERLRNEFPGLYESYADMALNEWITMKIVVKDKQAKLFLNGNQYPSLIVNDLKHGSDAAGSIGLWVEVGTEGYFKDLKITRE